MDKDEICFFNLIDLIEEYGYTSIDYLYYKRRDNLVALQLDTNVMEMLEENKSKKNVSLFVTRQRIATIAPTKSNKEPSKSTTNKAKEKSGTKKKKQLNVIQSKQQYANEVDHQHDDDGIQETSGDNNKVIRRKGIVLAHVWDLPEENRILVKCNQLGQPIGNEGGLLGQFLGTISRNGGYCPIHIKDWRKTKFLYPRSCEKWILKSIGRDWRNYKATLKSKLYNPKKKRSALYKLCPDDIDEHQWKALVKYWKSAKGKELSEKNKVSRGMKKTAHTASTKSYARWSEDLTHMLEEIKQIKDHSRRQDKVIDELIIKKMHHESEEPTKIDHDKFQNHVVSSNRKRVRCAEPNHVDVVCQQRDKLCQGDGNHIGFSDQEAQPSSPQCSTNIFRQKEFDVCTRNSSDGRITRKRKIQQGAPQGTISKTQQVAAHDKVTSHKRSKYTPPPPIKVMRSSKRDLTNATRVELSNNRFTVLFFQQQEKKLVAEIKRTAKTGNEAATKILARQLIRLRQQISNLQGSRAQIRGIATHTQAMHANTSVATGLQSASKAMGAVNKQMAPEKQMKIMKEFQKQSAQMDMTNEMMSDSIDDVLDDDQAEEETEELANQVLDEIGVDIASQLSSAPKGKIAGKKVQLDERMAI
ncbi:hypothetical protein C2845_PM01G39910 [Panicum miliaceum]|uniref:PB1-like domain-containing protein n=1 Tax=Panicum miliaceum TaxID=4540 RepID=A0A3L6TIX6_PANMI|nr:hypothetical protein C2845_PM01G39910 [Panicum miliaceum]